MQPIPNGPDIPSRLLHAHEEGKVVFFCGAGISYPRLPTFSGLVKRLYSKLGIEPNEVQDAAIKAGQFDIAIGLLEGKYGIPDGHAKVRYALAEILNLKRITAKNIETHEALMTLARTRDDRLRLITTNFDRFFEAVIKRNKIEVETFKAPLLPVPKSKWNGLVYLHGLISKKPTLEQLNHLVISSGDFGLAYLSEAWAARFVSELFRNYSVCFVGYSINDPVLRYMMDALAADQMLGESPPEMFAFGSYTLDTKIKIEQQWRAKNVTPILYQENEGHTNLHHTLKEWANIYNDAIDGKENIVAKYAVNPPTGSTLQDDFVGRVLWAISHNSSLPAKKFAELNPVPPFSWITPITSSIFLQEDLGRFGVTSNLAIDKKIKFSFSHRPTPYTHAAYMSLFSDNSYLNAWDNLMLELAKWLARHLGDPDLVIWITKNGGPLNPRLKRIISDKFDELEKLEKIGDKSTIEKLLSNSPNAIPSKLLNKIWQLILSDRIKSFKPSADLYSWLDRLKKYGFSTLLKKEFRDVFSPCISISEPFRMDTQKWDHKEAKYLHQLFRIEILINAEYPHSLLKEGEEKTVLYRNLPALIDEINSLLLETLDLMAMLDLADQKHDRSYAEQPSIAEHAQNTDFNDWTVLIDLLRDAWISILDINQGKARVMALEWWNTPYPIFKRLALFASQHHEIISPNQTLSWLLSEERWWLFSEEIKRESIRALVSIGPKLNVQEMSELENAILAGPPNDMFIHNIDPEILLSINKRNIWLRLSKLRSANVVFTNNSEVISTFLNADQNWKLEDDQRDEFPIWHESDTDTWEWTKFNKSPEDRQELAIWLMEAPLPSFQNTDDWQDRCRNEFGRTATTLSFLASQDQWPFERWNSAIQTWTEPKSLKNSWRILSFCLSNAPDDLIKSCLHSISWWLKSLGAIAETKHSTFFKLIHRIIALTEDEGITSDKPVSHAINHPIGHTTQALIDWWYRKIPKDGEGFPAELESIFTTLCDTRLIKFGNGRVLLAANLLSLYRADEDWTRKHLLPLFEWSKSEIEAHNCWEGFLWSPRIYWPILTEMKNSFLETSKHYEKLGEHGRQYADFLTFIALENTHVFHASELRQALNNLTPPGLSFSAQALVRASGGNIDYVLNRVIPFLKKIWPQSTLLKSTSIAFGFASLCVSSGEAFPATFSEIKGWLEPLEHPDYIVHQLYTAGLHKLYPRESLDFLGKIIGNSASWIPRDLVNCLQEISVIDSSLVRNQTYRLLNQYAKSRNY